MGLLFHYDVYGFADELHRYLGCVAEEHHYITGRQDRFDARHVV